MKPGDLVRFFADGCLGLVLSVTPAGTGNDDDDRVSVLWEGKEIEPVFRCDIRLVETVQTARGHDITGS